MPSHWFLVLIIMKIWLNHDQQFFLITKRLFNVFQASQHFFCNKTTMSIKWNKLYDLNWVFHKIIFFYFHSSCKLFTDLLLGLHFSKIDIHFKRVSCYRCFGPIFQIKSKVQQFLFFFRVEANWCWPSKTLLHSSDRDAFFLGRRKKKLLDLTWLMKVTQLGLR